ncbi:MAG: DUF11 domain-containing protein [Planctomycetaceae bacterium]|nr:DUF11 domain-containing protein [Planctomycetaceae bacterium]
MNRLGRLPQLFVKLVALAALLGVCCAADWLPQIDPSGRRLFLPKGEHSYQKKPSHVTRRSESGVQIMPTRVIAPVGAEVVLTAGVCGKDGYMTAFERVEWSLAPGGVGYFIDVGRNGAIDRLRSTTRAEKIDNTFAVGITAQSNTMLTRGTPTPTDDVPVLRGQSWVTVSSPVEGTSYITAYAPDAYTWDKRKDTNTIYWIDANWSLPQPVFRPAGSEHTFVTTLTRATTLLPLANWRVRYEIVGGPPAVFMPNNTPVADVITNSLGQAPVQIKQVQAAAGTNDIRVQIIRPAELTPDGLKLNVLDQLTRVTWGPTTLTIDKQGPAQAQLGQPFTYRIDVRNSSTQAVKGVVLSDQLDPGLTFINANPPVNVVNQTLQWTLQDLVAGEARAVEIVVQANKPGPINNCAVARSADGIVVQDCVTTTVTAPSLTVDVQAVDQAYVGQRVPLVINVTNTSGAPATGLVLVTRLDPSLRHPAGQVIERDFEDLVPNQTRQIPLEVDVVAPGQACAVVELVRRDGAMLGSTRKCISALAAANPVPQVPAQPQPQPQPQPAQPPQQPQPAPAGPRPTLSVRKSGPDRRAVGERADFTIDITNTGTVPVTNLKLTDNYDQALNPLQATDGHAFAGDDLVWIVDALQPGKSIRFQVNCECTRRAPRACNRVTVTCAEGARADGEACLEVQGPANALTLTVTDSRDPVALGNDCVYDIRIKNNSSESDRQVRVSVVAPTEMQPVELGTQGQGVTFTVQGQNVTFTPINEIRAGETIRFQVNMRAVRPGTARVQVQATSTASTAPALGEASTTVIERQ